LSSIFDTLERKVVVCSTRQGYSRIVKGFDEFAVYRAVQLNPRCTISTPTEIGDSTGDDDLKRDRCQASPVGSLEGQPKERAMAANKPSGQETRSRAEVDQRNVIGVTFSDLPEDDQRRIKDEMRCELEEIEAAKMREKLACYQRTRSGVVQKADTTKATSSKVNPSSLTPEDLVHLVDVSMASKYGADLAQLTRALAKNVRHTLESFRQDMDDNLPRQIKNIVKEVVGVTQGKQSTDTAGFTAPHATLPHTETGAAAGGHPATQPVNPNYHTTKLSRIAQCSHPEQGERRADHGQKRDHR
jgi:hypothetical protein